jgi:TonB family protein
MSVALFCGALAAQDPKPHSAPSSPGKAIQDAARASAHDLPQDRPKVVAHETLYGAEGRVGAIEVLSNTQGVDFGPYSQELFADIRRNWYRLTPAYARAMKGKLTIDFPVLPDGRIGTMKLVSSSGDDSLDRSAWEGIKAASPFPALPKAFTGQSLMMRVRFLYNPVKR